MGKLLPARRDDLSRETGSCHACLPAGRCSCTQNKSVMLVLRLPTHWVRRDTAYPPFPADRCQLPKNKDWCFGRNCVRYQSPPHSGSPLLRHKMSEHNARPPLRRGRLSILPGRYRLDFREKDSI
jgi:hypothetical protein